MLSAPPAFVLSQDQTLREENRLPAREADKLDSPVSLSSKVVSVGTESTRGSRPFKRRASFGEFGGAERAVAARAVRERSLDVNACYEFSKTAAADVGGNKSRLAPEASGQAIRIVSFALEGSSCRVGDRFAVPHGRPWDDSSPLGVSSGLIRRNEPMRMFSRLHDDSEERLARNVERLHRLAIHLAPPCAIKRLPSLVDRPNASRAARKVHRVVRRQRPLDDVLRLSPLSARPG